MRTLSPNEQSHYMTLPTSQEFFADARQAFSYLVAAGFRTPEPEDHPTGAEIEFVGKNVAVGVSLDRRDSCIDCYVARVTGGALAKNDIPGGYWAHFHQFMVQRRKYRGAFREFREGLDMTTWQGALQSYARALRSLAPDIAADEASSLEPK
jgi:hypothetical protein